MIDILANKVSLCLRGNGGHNAGHTIVANGVTYDFHLIPSGLLNPTCVNLIGSGCLSFSVARLGDKNLTSKLGVVHVPSFFKELESLKAKGLNSEDRVFISDRGG
jgi:adenylosuccinate synthase